MNLPGMNLVVNATDNDKQGLLQSFFSQILSTAGITFREDTVPVTLRAVTPSSNPSRYWDDIDIRTALIEIAIDNPDLTPTQGTFSLTYGANTTPDLDFDITAAELSTALNALASITSAGGVTVEKDGVGFIVSFVTEGVRTLIQETDISLYPASMITIVRDQTGTVDIPEIQVISIFQAPAVYQNSFAPLPDAACSIVSTQTGSGSVPSSQQITFNPAPYDGSFVVTTALGTTASVPFNVSQTALAAALNAIDTAANRYSVTGVPGGPYTITDATGDNTAITVNVSGLIVPIGVTGVLSLDTPAMRARFEGVSGNAITLLLEIKVSFSGNPPSTLFQGSVMVNKNVIRSSGGGGFSPATPSAFLEFINNDYSITGFNGGAPLNVDGIATVTRIPGEVHAAKVSGSFYFWKLVAGAWPGGSAPDVIQPDDYASGTNEKYWQLQRVLGPVFIGSGASHAAGIVPDPGASAGTRKYLCENATFSTPPVFIGSGAGHATGSVPDPGASAGTTRVLYEDGTWGPPLPAGRFEVKTAAFTAASGMTYGIDTTPGIGSVIVTLPSSPSAGDWFRIFDITKNWGNYSVTVGTSGANFVDALNPSPTAGGYLLASTPPVGGGGMITFVWSATMSAWSVN